MATGDIRVLKEQADGSFAEHVLTAEDLNVSGGAADVRSDFVFPYTYTGRAAAGSATSASAWTIRRSEFSSAGAYVSTTTANNVEWDDRLTASYS